MKLIALLPAMLFCTALSSQKVNFNLGEPYKLPKKHFPLGFVGTEKTGFAQLSLRMGDDIVVQTLDKNYMPVNEQSVDISDVGKGFVSDQFLQLKNSYYWYYSTWNREEQREYLHYRPFDLKNNRFSNSDQTIIKANKLAGATVATGFYRFDVVDKYNFNVSADSSKMLVTYRLKPLEKKDKYNKDKIGFNVFDHNMKKLWSNEMTMPYTEAEMDNADFEVASDGSVYMLAKVYEPREEVKGKDKRKTPDYHYELFRITKNSATPEILKLDLDGRFIRSSILNEDNKGNLILGGYYSKKRDSYGSEGAFILRIEFEDHDISAIKKYFFEFPLALLKQFESKRTQKKMEKKDKKNKEKGDDSSVEASNLTLREIRFDKDGSTTIVGEEYYSITVCTTDSKGHTSCRTTYYYQDIIAMRVDDKGKIVWANKIPKNQAGGAGTGGMSYFHHQYKGEDYFFYLDNVKNINLPLTAVPAVHRDGAGGFLTMVKIDKSGKMSKKSLFDTKEQKIRVFPTNFKSVAENKILTRVNAKKRQSRVLSLQFN